MLHMILIIKAYWRPQNQGHKVNTLHMISAVFLQLLLYKF